MKQIIRLTESDLHKIVKESVNRVMMEGVEFQSDNPVEESCYYIEKLEDAFDEFNVMVLNKVPDNNYDKRVIERYITMLQTHLRNLYNKTA